MLWQRLEERQVWNNEKKYICGNDFRDGWWNFICTGHVHGIDSRMECVLAGSCYGSHWAAVLLVMVLVWRKMENKEPIKLSGKTIGATLLGIVGALLLGVGMCLTMVWSHMVAGIVIGIVGIVVLLCLIPFIKGLK